MNNVKTKGVVDENGIKNFMLTNTDTGEVHVAMRDGQKFILGEFRGTLAQCKQLVAASKVVHFADAQPERAPEGTWDHVDANALLILRGSSDVTEAEIRRTLDANGWLTPEGEPDVVAARENFSKWSK